MPSTKSTKKAQSVLDFAKHLQDYLDKTQTSPTQPFPDISVYVEVLPLSRQDISPSQRLEFDLVGVAIWNRCRTLRESHQDHLDLTDLAKARAFAYLVLDTAASAHRTDAANQRTFNIGIKAVKECLLVDNGDALVEIGTKIVEQLAAKLEGVSPELRTQYLLLRVLLAWKQDRLELAEHFGHQLEDNQDTLTPGDRQQLGDLCYEIGNDQMKLGHTDLARQWFQRGISVFTDQENGFGDVDTSDLQFNLMHSHVRALLASHGGEIGDEGLIALESLRLNFDKFPVKVLQLEAFARNPETNQGPYYSVLIDVIRCAHLIPTNHKLIIHHIHLLRHTSTELASQALRIYIVQRLALHDDIAWVESGLLTLIWMLVTSPGCSASTGKALQLALSDTYEVWSNALSPEANHGALVLLWKRIGDSTKSENHGETVQWCSIALHKIFSSAGDDNVGKIERTMIKCHLELSQYDAALGIFENMGATRKIHPLSRFLYYSLALRRQDDSLVQSALSALALVHNDQNRMLFAAVSEAMKYGTKRQGAQLLQRILDKYHNTPSPEVATPLLLRCTASLLLLALAEEDHDSDELLSRLCAIFKAAAILSQNLPSRDSSSTGLSFRECRWFEVTSFRAAVEHINTWPNKYIIDLLCHSCQIRYPDDSSRRERGEKKIHEIDASCVQAMLYLIEARACCSSTTISDMPKSSYSSKTPPTTEEIRSTLYRNVVDKYSFSRSLVDALLEDLMDREILKDANQKLISLLPFAFESTLFLTLQAPITDLPKSLLSLSQLIDDAVEMKAPETAYALIVDMILASVTAEGDDDAVLREGDQTRAPTSTARLPPNCATELLSKLIHNVRNEPTYDISQASRWIRCVVQLILDHHDIGKWARASGSEPGSNQAQPLQAVKTITEQALSLASGSDHLPCLRYPAEEVEWLASTLFNLSVDILYWNQGNTDQTGSNDIGGKQEPHNNNNGPRPKQRESSTCHETDLGPQTLSSAISGDTTESGAAPGAKVPRDAGTGLPSSNNLNPNKFCPDEGTDLQSKETEDAGCCDTTAPQVWARLAVQLADLLDDRNRGSPGRDGDLQNLAGRVPGDGRCASAGDELVGSQGRQGGGGGGEGARYGYAYGDGGALARVIRERCRMLGWEDLVS